MNILVIGGTGKTAGPILDALDRGNHRIMVFDVVSPAFCDKDERHTYIRGDIADGAALHGAMDSIDAVIHLAVNVVNAANEKLTFDTNVFGTYNVLRACVKSKISKVLIASSAPVHTIDETNRDDGYICSAGEDFAYDLTKNMQEVMARHFSRTYALNCLVLRLGHIVDGQGQTSLSGEPLSRLSYCRGGWVCQYDVAEAFAKAVEQDIAGYNMVHIIGSYQAESRFDSLAAKQLLGFTCRERFLDY